MSGHFGFFMKAVKCQVTACDEWATTIRPIVRGTIWVCSDHAHLYPYPSWQ